MIHVGVGAVRLIPAAQFCFIAANFLSSYSHTFEGVRYAFYHITAFYWVFQNY